jgi:hypothetical protein
MTASQTTAVSPLIAEHAQAIKDRAACIPGEKMGKSAGLTRRIRTLELSMVIESVSFTPWVAPKAPAMPSRSDADLTDRIAKLQTIIDGNYPATIKTTARQELARNVKDAQGRGLIPLGEITVTAPTKTPRKTKVTA